MRGNGRFQRYSFGGVLSLLLVSLLLVGCGGMPGQQMPATQEATIESRATEAAEMVETVVDIEDTLQTEIPLEATEVVTETMEMTGTGEVEE
jgi:outer membrane PBP1 activator LpoA protein